MPPPENADRPNTEFDGPAPEPNADVPALANAANPPPPDVEPLGADAVCANALGVELAAPKAVAGLINAD